MDRTSRSKRYFSADDEAGITPSRLARLGREKQIEYMRYWFYSNFEDPANETPYNSEEGGYVYIYGGPYDANEELSTEFGGIVSDARIAEAVEIVELSGFEWAPGPEHPDHQRARDEYEQELIPGEDNNPGIDLDAILRELERGVQPMFGAADEKAQRQAILDQLSELRRTLELVRPTHGGIGHNHPPPDDEAPQEQETDAIRRAEVIIRLELEKVEPDALEVAKATSRLRTALGWLAKNADVAVESFAKGFGGAAGKTAGTAAAGFAAFLLGSNIPGLGGVIQSVISSVVGWLRSVMQLF